jgi:hypothetical protein
LKKLDYFTDLDVSKIESREKYGLRKEYRGIHSPYLYCSSGRFRVPFAMHKEDMGLASVNYLHWGAPKVWMVVSPDYEKRFEDAVAKHYPITKGINCSQRIRNLGLFVRPVFLDKASIRYSLILQQPGDLIITFAGAYHQGFNVGANMAEAVNYAWTGWTPKAVECVRG